MKYIAILLIFLSFGAFAEVGGVNFLRVSCDNGAIIKDYLSPKPVDLAAADTLARKSFCASGKVRVEKNYWHKSIPGSSASSMAAASSSSASSAPLPKLATLTIRCPASYADGQPLDCATELKEYRLKKPTHTEIIKPTGDTTIYMTFPPKDGEVFYLSAVAGAESSYSVVEVIDLRPR